MNYNESLHYYRRASNIPGRSLTRSKAPGRFFDVGAGPMYASSGYGCRLIDADGNEFIDMLCALGAISLGYGAIDVTEEQIDGQTYSLPSFIEPVAAEHVLSHVAPWATHVRFMKTGSEATHAAYRIAKAATGRQKVLVGNWAYHGWHEWCDERDTGRGTITYANAQDLDALVEPDSFAAVFVEPPRWGEAGGDVPALLSGVRAWCDKHGALMVVDEMIYGGRWAVGGATEYYGVQPDLACYGKAFGNGTPIAFVVGRDVLRDHGEIASGTYSGDAVALAAVCNTIRIYTNEPVIDTLWERGSQLANGLAYVIRDTGVAAKLEGQPVHQRIAFDTDTGGGWGGGWGVNRKMGRAFAAAMARRGVLWHPDCVNVCYEHTTADIDMVVAAAADSLREVL